MGSLVQSAAIVGWLALTLSEAIAPVGSDKGAFGSEHCQSLVKRRGADAAQRAQLGELQRVVDVC